MTQLYALAGQYQELMSLDADDAGVADTLEAIEGAIEDKANNIAIMATGMKANIDVIDAEIKRLNDMKRTIKNRDASLRNYLKTNMEATGIKNIKCDLFSITLANGRDVVAIHNEDDIPDDYTVVETVIKPDKKKIMDALKEGAEVAGASLTKSDKSLRIK